MEKENVVADPLWSQFRPLISLGLIHACYLAQILEKLSGPELTREVKDRVIENACHLFFELDKGLEDRLTTTDGSQPQPSPQSVREEIFEKLKKMNEL